MRRVTPACPVPVQFWYRSDRSIFEVDEIDVLAGAMLGHFQKVDDSRKSGPPRQRGRNVVERDLADGSHFDKAGAQRIAATDFHMRSLPYPNAAGDLATHDRLAQSFGE